jgi:hypothetical protein
MHSESLENIFDTIFPYLDPNLSPDGDSFENLSDYVMDRIQKKDFSKLQRFLKNDLTSAEKDRFFTLIKLYHLADIFSSKFTQDQYTALINNGLIEVPDDVSRFSLSSISARLRASFIREHFNENGIFDSKLTRLFSDIRNLFNLYGEDVRFCDILGDREIALVLECSRHNHTWSAMRDLSEQIDDMYYYSIVIPPGEFIIVRDDDEEVRYESKKKPYAVKSDELTPKGYAVSAALNLLFNNGFHKSRLEEPLRTCEPFQYAYFQPNSEERIIRDYYDEIYGFRRFWDYMETKDDLIKMQKLWPRFLGIQPNPQYGLFKQEFIRMNILTQEQITRIEKNFIEYVADMIDSLLPDRESHPFLISKMLEEDYPDHYKTLKNQIQMDLDSLFDSTGGKTASKIKDAIRNRMLYACVFYDTIFDRNRFSFPGESQKQSSDIIKDKLIAFMAMEYFDSDIESIVKIEKRTQKSESDVDLFRDLSNAEINLLESNDKAILTLQGKPTTTASKIIALYLRLLFGDDNSSDQVRERYNRRQQTRNKS